MKQFEEFVVSTTERELRQIREEFARRRNAFAALKTTTDAVEEAVRELRLEHEAKADAIGTAIAENEKRRAAVAAALAEDKDLQANCQIVENAMSKCSTWLPGHDQAAAARAPVPGAAELKQDIEALDAWVKAVRARRCPRPRASS